MGRPVSYPDATETMAAGFASALNLQLVPEELTASEWAAVERIRSEKYANDQWTFKR